ncbi:hypothetical protein NP233_g11020 [Leucocoprinus birnbaumii]|uniref:Uncharacterized protein n=1 Tax=Leucocoprinus birnbaumii TaxID=56174 RepID=A0AAD5YLN1_9AGAR|nr:hypothetical protein NP233_g11020 [Leucocoprinus birnbaumii]
MHPILLSCEINEFQPSREGFTLPLWRASNIDFEEVRPLVVIEEGELDRLIRAAVDVAEGYELVEATNNDHNKHEYAEDIDNSSDLSDLPVESDSEEDGKVPAALEKGCDSGDSPGCTENVFWTTALGFSKKLTPNVFFPIPLNSEVAAKDLQLTAGIYEAVPLHRAPIDRSLPKLELEALVKANYKRITWDSITPRPLLDSCNKVIAILAGRPDHQDFMHKCQWLFLKMNEVALKIDFADGEKHHPRGNYPAVNVGITPGQGAVKPSFTIPHENEMKQLLYDEDFQDLADFHSFTVNMWCCGMYERFRNCIKKLQKHKRLSKKLKFLTPAGVFPRIAFNFGPMAWTEHHRDPKDYALAWCIVQSLGKFDPTKGGHCVLDDLKLFIEFPPGSIILLPSATFLHANLPVHVSEGEARASITQYFPGGLLRYVDNGFRLQSSISKMSRKIREEAAQRRAELWESDSMWFESLEDLVEEVG